jgi:hypothetical protein
MKETRQGACRGIHSDKHNLGRLSRAKTLVIEANVLIGISSLGAVHC